MYPKYGKVVNTGNESFTTEDEIWIPAEGKRIQVKFLRFTVSDDCWVELFSGSPAQDEIPEIPPDPEVPEDPGTPGVPAVPDTRKWLVNQAFNAGSGVSEDHDFVFELPKNQPLKLKCSAGTISLTVCGWEV